MEIRTEVIHYGEKSTTSILKVNGVFQCFILEDVFRQNGVKIKGKTAIGAGRYEIKIRDAGGMTTGYAKHSRLKDIHRGMLHLQDVDNFSWVYIHIGNDQYDTHGCLLTGETYNPLIGFVGSSTDAYISLYKKIVKAMDKGEEIFIRVCR